ncbi:hypothetical protein, partial [Xanthomonas oryzae]
RSHQAGAGRHSMHVTRVHPLQSTPPTPIWSTAVLPIAFGALPHLIVEMTASDLSVSRCLFIPCIAAA